MLDEEPLKILKWKSYEDILKNKSNKKRDGEKISFENLR